MAKAITISLSLLLILAIDVNAQTGACCDDNTGECLDNVNELDCPENYRFAPDTLCSELDPPCGECPESEITIEIRTDDYPAETTWEVTDHQTGEIIASGGPYTDPNSLYTHDVCVPTDGCFDFTIYDSFGDGIFCGYGGGCYYRVYFNSELVGSGMQFGYEETVPNIGNGCVDCVVDCPDGSTPEGEVDCYDDYIDDYNSGCQEEFLSWSSVICGETICGTSGYYVRNDSTKRDTDWYELILNEPAAVSMIGVGEMPYQQLIITPGDPGVECDELSIDYYTQTAACDTAIIEMQLDAGTYWLWAGAYDSGGPLAPCGSTYWFTVTCEAPPLGACCDIDFNCIGDMNQFDCEASGDANWYEGESCDDPVFSCPYPRQLGLAQTGNIPNCGVSNYGPLGETDAQGNTYDWNGMGSANFAGTFVMGNSPTTMFSYYNPGVTDCHEYTATDFLNITNPFSPRARFSDGGVLGGVTIDYCGQGFDDPSEARDIFVHVFNITNTGVSAINDYYAGVFFDWDVAYPNPDNVVFDRANNLMYQGHNGDYLFGLCLINADEVNLRSMSAVSIGDYIWAPPFGGGWRQEDLHMIMSHDGDAVWDEFSEDMSSLMSTGPHTIEPGESISVQIAVIGAYNAADMVARAQYADTMEFVLCDPDLAFPCGHYVVGDFNGSGEFNIADIIEAFNNYIWPRYPELRCECPPGSGNFWHVRMDLNNSCAFNIADIITGFSKLKTGSPELVPCYQCPPAPPPAPPGGEQPEIAPVLKSKAGILKQ